MIKPVNVFAFYRLGKRLESAVEQRLSKLGEDLSVFMAIFAGRAYSDEFAKSEPIGLSRSQKAALKISDEIKQITSRLEGGPKNVFHDHDIGSLIEAVADFEAVFESECSEDARIFAVMPRGIYDTIKLLDKAELVFEERVRNGLPGAVLQDVNLAGRCLALDLWSATGFHSIRAVELMARRYHQVVTDRSEMDERTPLGGLANDLKQEVERQEGNKFTDSPLGLVSAMLGRHNKIYRIPVMHPQMSLDEHSASEVFQVSTTVIPIIYEDWCRRSGSNSLRSNQEPSPPSAH